MLLRRSSRAVAILPLNEVSQQDFTGQKCLGYYPWVDDDILSLSSSGLRVHRSVYDYKGWSTG